MRGGQTEEVEEGEEQEEQEEWLCEREKVLLQTGLRGLITVKHQTLISGIKTLYESSSSKLQRRKNIQKKPAGVLYIDLKASFSLNCGAVVRNVP